MKMKKIGIYQMIVYNKNSIFKWSKTSMTWKDNITNIHRKVQKVQKVLKVLNKAHKTH